MLETIPLLAALATAPAPFDAASVEIDKAGPCVHVVALDTAKEFAGSIFICGDNTGNMTIEADFADDLYLSMDTSQRKVESNDPREAASRVALIFDKLDPDDVQANWGSCIFSTAGTVAGVVAASPWAIASSYAMACDCLPLLIEEFEDMSCPLW